MYLILSNKYLVAAIWFHCVLKTKFRWMYFNLKKKYSHFACSWSHSNMYFSYTIKDFYHESGMNTNKNSQRKKTCTFLRRLIISFWHNWLLNYFEHKCFFKEPQFEILFWVPLFKKEQKWISNNKINFSCLIPIQMC